MFYKLVHHYSFLSLNNEADLNNIRVEKVSGRIELISRKIRVSRIKKKQKKGKKEKEIRESLVVLQILEEISRTL